MVSYQQLRVGLRQLTSKKDPQNPDSPGGIKSVCSTCKGERIPRKIRPPGRTPRIPASYEPREPPQDQDGSKQTASDQGRSAKDFHFREAGVQRFNDTYDWDDDER